MTRCGEDKVATQDQDDDSMYNAGAGDDEGCAEGGMGGVRWFGGGCCSWEEDEEEEETGIVSMVHSSMLFRLTLW